MSAYPRGEHAAHYLNRVKCTYSATVPIEITQLRAALKTHGLRAYPAQIYLLARAVNRFPEFRTSLDENRELGYWDSLSPMYTVLCPETNTFSAIWTPYQDDFAAFYRACITDIERYATGAFMPQQDIPKNVFDVSSIPWVDFTAFNLNLTPGDHLLPIFTIGKYTEQSGATHMPLAIQVHHAACDGYHLGQFVDEVKRLAANIDEWFIV